MYDNIGKKIQTISQIVGWAALIIAVLTWFVLIINGESVPTYYGYDKFVFDTTDDWIGWVALIAGGTYYIASWFIYGFGQLVDDVHAMRDQNTAPAPQEGSSSVSYNNLPEL